MVGRKQNSDDKFQITVRTRTGTYVRKVSCEQGQLSEIYAEIDAAFNDLYLTSFSVRQLRSIGVKKHGEKES